MRLGVTFHVVYAGIAYAVLCRVYAANAVNGMSACCPCRLADGRRRCADGGGTGARLTACDDVTV